MSAPSVSVFIAKGGCGKTMTTLQLAGSYAATGMRVQVVDLDPQMGAISWSRLAQQAGVPVPFVVSAAPAPGFDLVLYDHAPTLPANLTLPGRVVVVPTLLDASSWLGAERTRTAVQRLGLPALLVPNRVRTDRLEQRQLLSMLGEQDPGLRTIRDRACYPSAFGRGSTVFTEGLRLAHTQAARDEIDAVRDRIDNLLSEVLLPAALAGVAA